MSNFCIYTRDKLKLNTHGSLVVSGSFVQQLTAVLLGSDGGWQVDGDHLQKSFSSGEPATHHSLQERLALLVLVLRIQLDIQLLDQFSGFLLLEVHDGVEHLARNPFQLADSCLRWRTQVEHAGVKHSFCVLLRLWFIITGESGQSEECLSHHLQAHTPI